MKIDKQTLKNVIQNEVFVTKEYQKIIEVIGREDRWIFDFRKIFLDPQYINLIAEIFWERYEHKYPFQVCGLETAAIPLVTAIVMKSVQKNKPVNGFFIRKSRKKIGLLKTIEGKINNEKIIIVDDLINTGNSIMQQITVLEEAQKKISAVFTIVRFRDVEYYHFLKDRDMILNSLFPITDFGLGFLNNPAEQKFLGNIFKTEWYFQSKNPNYFYVVPKSTPALDEDKIYFGSDSGNFWALNQNDGSIAWKYKVGWHTKGKSIFSAPVVYDDTVCFGSYDGNVYALDTKTGKKKWAFMEADWVGSSPALAHDLGLLFIGLEFGLWKKHGGIVALDMKTGEKKWEHITSEYTHCSSAYLKLKQMVAIGSNDSTVYLYNAKNGTLLWKRTVGAEIKASFVFDEKRNALLFGSFDGNLYCLNIDTGEIVFRYQTKDIIYSTPTIYNNAVLVSSADKRLYSINLDSGSARWIFEASGRILSSPTVINQKIYIGSNDGRLYEIDPENGQRTGFFQATERITNKVVYNEKTKRFFLFTFANEIYCLTRKP